MKTLNTKYPILNTRSGFTLIEIMVAVSIFSMVMVVAIGAVLAIVSANKRAQALNSVISNLNFAIEGMVRDLRTGYNYDCGEVGGETDCSTSGGASIQFNSAQFDGDVTYGLDVNSQCGKGLYKIESGQTYCITGEDVRIEELKFYVAGSIPASASQVQPNTDQAKILITIKGNFVGYGSLGDFNLQSMVSQRKLDI